MNDTLKVNQSGYLHAESEDSLRQVLEQTWLPKHFTHAQGEIEFAPSCFIDYLAIDQQPKTVLIEVKNWFVKVKDMEQIMKYLVHATEKYGPAGFRFILICGGIDKERKRLLEALGVEIKLTREIL